MLVMAHLTVRFCLSCFASLVVPKQYQSDCFPLNKGNNDAANHQTYLDPRMVFKP